MEKGKHVTFNLVEEVFEDASERKEKKQEKEKEKKVKEEDEKKESDASYVVALREELEEIQKLQQKYNQQARENLHKLHLLLDKVAALPQSESSESSVSSSDSAKPLAKKLREIAQVALGNIELQELQNEVVVIKAYIRLDKQLQDLNNRHRREEVDAYIDSLVASAKGKDKEQSPRPTTPTNNQPFLSTLLSLQVDGVTVPSGGSSEDGGDKQQGKQEEVVDFGKELADPIAAATAYWKSRWGDRECIPWKSFVLGFSPLKGYIDCWDNIYYKCIHTLLGESVKCKDFITFIAWFNPKKSSENFLENVYLTLKIPGFHGFLSETESKELLVGEPVGSLNQLGRCSIVYKDEKNEQGLRVQSVKGGFAVDSLDKVVFPSFTNVIKSFPAQLKVPVRGSVFERMFEEHETSAAVSLGVGGVGDGGREGGGEVELTYLPPISQMSVMRNNKMATLTLMGAVDKEAIREYRTKTAAFCYCADDAQEGSSSSSSSSSLSSSLSSSSPQPEVTKYRRSKVCLVCGKILPGGVLLGKEKELALITDRFLLFDKVESCCINFFRSSSPSDLHTGSQVARLTKGMERKPSFDFSRTGSNHIQYLENNIIKAATIERLIKELTSGDTKMEDVITFLDCYLLHISPSSLITLLAMRWKDCQTEAERVRVVLLFCRWLGGYGDDIVESDKNVRLLKSIRKFLDVISPTPAGKKMRREIIAAKTHLKGISMKVAAYNSHRGHSRLPYLRRSPYETESLFPENLHITHFPPPLLSPGQVEIMCKAKHLDIKSLPPLEVARQITLIEHELYRRIKRTELLSRKWESEPTHAPNLYMLSQFCAKLDTWMILELLKGKTPQQRATTISFYIALALALNDVKNYAGLISILCLLDGTVVSVLKETWKYVPANDVLVYNSLKGILGDIPSFHYYRRALASAAPPYIPYPMVYMRDITNISVVDRGVGEGMVSFQRMRELSKAIQTCTYSQDVLYPIQPLLPLIDKLLSLIMETDAIPINHPKFVDTAKRLEP